MIRGAGRPAYPAGSIARGFRDGASVARQKAVRRLRAQGEGHAVAPEVPATADEDHSL